ncbi:MAG: hypothetical protein OXU45_07700 [Candidatus Melainabacteria bacterium]|nr:hypothetical protein [Candidatus Melainabacteria bacterium]
MTSVQATALGNAFETLNAALKKVPRKRLKSLDQVDGLRDALKKLSGPNRERAVTAPLSPSLLDMLERAISLFRQEQRNEKAARSSRYYGADQDKLALELAGEVFPQEHCDIESYRRLDGRLLEEMNNFANVILEDHPVQDSNIRSETRSVRLCDRPDRNGQWLAVTPTAKGRDLEIRLQGPRFQEMTQTYTVPRGSKLAKFATKKLKSAGLSV